MAEIEGPQVEIAEMVLRVDGAALGHLDRGDLVQRVQAQMPSTLPHRRQVADAIAEAVADAVAGTQARAGR